MRRNLYELAAIGPAPVASEALRYIRAFYAIEKKIRCRSAEKRRLVRQEGSRQLAEAFERQARFNQPEDQAREGHLLSPLTMATADTLH